MFHADIAHSPRTRAAPHGAAADGSLALDRATGFAAWTLVIGCLVWRGPFRFVLGTVGAGLLLHGARSAAAGASGAQRAIH